MLTRNSTRTVRARTVKGGARGNGVHARVKTAGGLTGGGDVLRGRGCVRVLADVRSPRGKQDTRQQLGGGHVLAQRVSRAEQRRCHVSACRAWAPRPAESPSARVRRADNPRPLLAGTCLRAWRPRACPPSSRCPALLSGLDTAPLYRAAIRLLSTVCSAWLCA